MSGALSAGTVSLGVKGDATGFGSKLAADIKGQGAVFGDLGKHLGGLITAGLGMAGIGLSIGAVLKTGFDEASDASAGIAQLAAGIKSTGNAAGVSVKGMTDLASSIQDMSGQTDDSVVKAEQLLLTFTNIKNSGPNKIFDEATLAASNMAAKMGGDASSQAILLGKALNDPVKGLTALQRVGVAFTDSQKTQIAAMVKSGDTMGAQKIILGELSKEFGGAAEAAGQTLPGMLDRGKRAFEDMSQAVVETLLPIVMPAIAGVSGAVKAASPYIVDFAAAFSEKLKNGIQQAQPFLSAIGDKIKDVGAWITGTAVPAIQSLVKGFQDGTGPGGAIRDVVDGVWSVVKLLGNGLASLDLPGKFSALAKGWQDGTGAGGALKDVAGFLLTAFSDLGTFLSGTLVPGIQDTTKWMKDHKQLLSDVAGVIGVLLIPMFVDMGVKATISAAQTVAGWVASKVEAATSAAAEFAAHYTAVAGWVAHAAAATATGVTNGIIWAQLYTEAALGAAKNIASHVLVAVSGWGVQAAAAITAGITTAGVWADQALQAGLGAAKAIGGLLVVAGGWIASAATAMASGVIMAAAWIVGLGPVGWIIGAIVAVGAAFVLLYTKVGWFHDGVNAIWNGIKVAFGAVADWLVGAWNGLVGFWQSAVPKIGAVFGGIGEFVKGGFDGVVNFVKGIFNQIAGLVNGVIDGINSATSLAGAIGVHIGVIPHLPRLAEGATVLPTPGGTVVRVAEAGKAESVVDTGKLNNLLDQALGTGPRSSPVDLSDKSIAAIVEGNVAASKNVALTTTSADKWGSSMGRTTRPRGW